MDELRERIEKHDKAIERIENKQGDLDTGFAVHLVKCEAQNRELIFGQKLLMGAILLGFTFLSLLPRDGLITALQNVVKH